MKKKVKRKQECIHFLTYTDGAGVVRCYDCNKPQKKDRRCFPDNHPYYRI